MHTSHTCPPALSGSMAAIWGYRTGCLCQADARTGEHVTRFVEGRQNAPALFKPSSPDPARCGRTQPLGKHGFVGPLAHNEELPHNHPLIWLALGGTWLLPPHVIMACRAPALCHVHARRMGLEYYCPRYKDLILSPPAVSFPPQKLPQSFLTDTSVHPQPTVTLPDSSPRQSKFSQHEDLHHCHRCRFGHCRNCSVEQHPILRCKSRERYTQRERESFSTLCYDQQRLIPICVVELLRPCLD